MRQAAKNREENVERPEPPTRRVARLIVGSLMISAIAWLGVGSLITFLAPDLSPSIQAFMLFHRTLGFVFLFLVFFYYPVHIVLAHGFNRKAVQKIFGAVLGVIFIGTAYVCLTHFWEIDRRYSIVVIALAYLLFELFHQQRKIWKRALDLLPATILTLWALRATRDELVRLFFVSVIFYAVFKLGSAVIKLRRKQIIGDGIEIPDPQPSGTLAVWSAFIMSVFSVMMYGGTNSGVYSPFLPPMEYVHYLTGFLFVGLVAVHVVATSRIFVIQRWRKQVISWPAVAVINVVVLGLAIGSLSNRKLAPERVDVEDASPVRVSEYSNLLGYQGPGGYDWFEVPTANCASGRCHREVVEQHDLSAHGQAFTNEAFQIELAMFIEERGREAADYCIACHAPLGVIEHPGDGSRGPVVDPLTTEDPSFTVGVGCVVCHRAIPERDREKLGNASLTIRPYWLEQERYLGEDLQDHQRTQQILIAGRAELHQRQLHIDEADEDYVCGACHVVTLPSNLSCDGQERLVADHFLSFLDSEFARAGLSCASCHQQRFETHELTYRTIAHNYLGSGASLPYADLEQDGRLRDISMAFLAGLGDISLEASQKVELPPCLDDLPQYNPELVLIERDPEEPFDGRNAGYKFRGMLRTEVYVVEEDHTELEVRIVTTNECVAHVFPAGGGIRAYVELTVRDDEGSVLVEAGGLGPDGKPVDLESSLGSIAVDIHGEPVRDRKFWEACSLIHQRRILPGESIEDVFTIPLPKGSDPAVVKARWLFLRPELIRSVRRGEGREAAPVLIGRGEAWLGGRHPPRDEMEPPRPAAPRNH